VGTGDTPEQAADSARREVAAQIRTHVRSRLTDVTRLRGNVLKQRFESISQNITDVHLEGLEILKQYKGRRRCYALAGLNKSVYLGKIADRVDKLFREAADERKQAVREKAAGRFAAFYLRLKTAAEKLDRLTDYEYLYRSFRAGGSPSGDAAFRLQREVARELNGFLSSVTAAKEGDGQKARRGRPLPKPLAAVFSAGGKPLAGFPVRWEVTRGRMEIDATSRTDAKGRTTARVVRVEESPVKTARISCRLVLDGMKEHDRRYVQAGTEFTVTVEGASRWLVYVHEPGGGSVVSTALVSDMRSGGVEVHHLTLSGAFDEQAFLEHARKKFPGWNVVIGVLGAGRPEVTMGTATVVVDGRIKAVELSSGRVIFQLSLEKAVGVSYTGDAREALRNALATAGKRAAAVLRKELGY